MVTCLYSWKYPPIYYNFISLSSSGINVLLFIWYSWENKGNIFGNLCCCALYI